MERTALDRLRKIEKVWGSPNIGLVLTAAHYEGECLSADDIAAQTGLTRATTYNHLKRLENVGRVTRQKTGRNSVYCAVLKWASWTRDTLLGNERMRGQPPAT